MLKIGIAEWDDMRRHGDEAYPSECCGILLGTVEGGARVVGVIVRCANANTESPHHRYSIAPLEVVRAQRDARDRGMEIVGFYHSHPDHPPQWSSTDLNEAHWIGCSYVITAVVKGIAAESRSFVLAGKLEEDKSFVEEELVRVL